jgi:cytochrome c oxidase cbb3-type subunit 3/ubiquinol-cytochrome c reductase cytochrome c subunit
VDAVISFIRTWEAKPRATLDERPISGDPVKGAATYAVQCNKCHGAHGLAGPNVHIGNPQLLNDASNGFLRRAILAGRSGTAMASFEHALGEKGVEDLVALLRSWQEPNMSVPQFPPPPAPTPPLPLGPVPLNPRGPAPVGFRPFPATTPADVVKGQLDRKAKMAFLDARAPSDYVNQHIAGAVSVPFYDPDPYFDSLPKDAWLVCYCACPHAESSTLAQKLVTKGFTKVTVLDEGLGVWASRKYGVRSGTEP